MAHPLSLEDLDLKLDTIIQNQAETGKQYAHILSVLNQIYADRDMLLGVQSGVNKVRQTVINADKNNKEFSEDVVEALKEVKETAEEVVPQLVADTLKRSFRLKRLYPKGLWYWLTSKFRRDYNKSI